MKVSSNYYDYYYSQSNPLSSFSNVKTSTGNSNSSQSEAISFPTSRNSSLDTGAGNVIGLSYSGRLMRDSLQAQGADYAEVSEKMEKIKTDMDSIKTADIDTMSADDVKTALTNLQSDMESIQSPDGNTENIQQIDISSMSESDMRNILKEIQERAKSMPAMNEERQPMPMIFDPSQVLNNVSGSQNETISLDSGNDIQNNLQKILDNITESYDSSTESSDEYVEKIKDSLTSMFSQQKNNIDNFSNMIFSKLDDWSSDVKTSTQEA